MMGPPHFRFKASGAMLLPAQQGCPAMPDIKTLYDEDTVAWSENQAAALRAAAQGGSNQELDWENLAEEIEDLGKSIKRGIQSHIRNIIEHLIKLTYSSATPPREGWRETITNARVEIDALLDEAPSLRPRIEEFVRGEVPRAAKLAIGSLDRRGELTPDAQAQLKRHSYLDLFPYTPDQILGDWFPPEPQG